MTRTRTADRRPPAPQPKPKAATKGGEPKPESYRETVESIVGAFILALLIRGFEAEAFVIPTGSMAPTLMGRHKEVDCPQCGITFTVNGSEEERTGRPVVFGTCDNCRARSRVDDLPSFNGDRILVLKFPYELPWLPLADRPERWDVVVFHYPEEPEQNYIKRLVGLPGEELMIRGGDVYARPIGTDGPFEIRRKPPRHLRAMLSRVYDDRYRPPVLADLNDWRRWAPLQPGHWSEPADEPGTFVAGSAEGTSPAWLRYRHLVPDFDQAARLSYGRAPETEPVPSLIDDFAAYNTDQGASEERMPPLLEPHWVGDLDVRFVLDVEEAGGTLIVELIEGGVPHRATIDLSRGTATLSRDGKPLGEPAEVGIDGPGRHRIEFANVDDRLTLWVDGRLPFGDGLPFEVDHENPPPPTVADLAPVGIGVDGAKVRVSGLVLNRDIYYTLNPSYSDLAGFGTLRSWGDQARVRALLRDPSRFAELVDLDEPRTFAIRPGRYMMLGDNSPRSLDGRAWGTRDTNGGSYADDRGVPWRLDGWTDYDRASYEVPEELIVGKAFFVYWPHGKPFGPDLGPSRDFRLPFRPYVERMQWIR